MSVHSPMIAEIDLNALAENTRAIRNLIGPGTTFYGVVKGDAYGIGLLQASPVILESGADAIATANPEDVVRLREAGIGAPVLLYPSAPPAMAREVAELGAIITLHDAAGIQAFASQNIPVKAHIKVDCGFGRLGFSEPEWASILEMLKRANNISVVGLYTHLGHTENPDSVHRQMAVFQRAVATAEALGFSDLERMVASTRVAIGYPEYRLNAVNPGRGLYGILESPWLERFEPRKVVTSISTKVLQVKTLPARSNPGYLDSGPLVHDMTIAVLAAGFANGLPRNANGMPVLIRGRRASTVGMRSTEHSVVDVTNIPGVSVGDEAVIIGYQGEASIDPVEFAEISGLPLIEILARVTRGGYRAYAPRGAGPR